MTDGGNAPARPDQSYDPPPGGQAVAGQRTNYRARQVIIFGTGPGSGLFVYSPVPGPGNLIASIAAANGTDPFGNTVLAGITEYHQVTPTFFTAVQLINGEIAFYDAAAQPGPWTQLYTINAAPAFDITDSASSNQIGMAPSGSGGAALIVNGESTLSGSAVINGDAIKTALTVTAGALQEALSVIGGIFTDTLQASGVATLQSGAQVTASAANPLAVNGNTGSSFFIVTNSFSTPGNAPFRIFTATAGDRAISLRATGDANDRLAFSTQPRISGGPGNATVDTILYRAAAGEWAADFIAANNGGSAEVWNAPTFANSWANAGTGPALQYRLVAAPYNSMQWVGRLTVPVGFTSGQAIITAIPAAYRPAHVQSVGAVDVTSGGFVRLQMGTGGVLLLESGVAAAGDTVDILPGSLVSLDA